MRASGFEAYARSFYDTVNRYEGTKAALEDPCGLWERSEDLCHDVSARILQLHGRTVPPSHRGAPAEVPVPCMAADNRTVSCGGLCPRSSSGRSCKGAEAGCRCPSLTGSRCPWHGTVSQKTVTGSAFGMIATRELRIKVELCDPVWAPLSCIRPSARECQTADCQGLQENCDVPAVPTPDVRAVSLSASVRGHGAISRLTPGRHPDDGREPRATKRVGYTGRFVAASPKVATVGPGIGDS